MEIYIDVQASFLNCGISVNLDLFVRYGEHPMYFPCVL